MRFESIEIKNFRQYKNQIFDFSNRNQNDLHIIIGGNGTGKTNLLNAITWCLYDKEFHLGNEKTALPRINIMALQDAIKNGKEECAVNVRISINSDNYRIIYQRTQWFNANKGKSGYEHPSKLIVTYMQKDKEAIVYEDDETVKRYINMFMPALIRQYFFFDGEQLDKYFLNDQGAEIKEAIYNISQVQLLTSMKGRLSNIIFDLQKEAGRKNPDIKELTQKKSQLEELIANKEQDIETITKQINESTTIITRNNEFLKSSEGLPEKEKQYEKLKQQLDEYNKNMNEMDTEIKDFIKKYKILFSFYPSMKETLDIINKKESEGSLPPQIDKNLLKQMLHIHKCLICKRDMDEPEELEVQKILSQLNVSSELSNLLSKIKGTLESNILKVKNYPNAKDKLIKRKREVEEEIKKTESEINKLDLYLKSFTNKQEIINKHKERAEHEKLKEDNLQKKGAYTSELKSLKSKLNEIQQQIKKSMEKIKEFKLINDKISFAERSKEIVEGIEGEMMTEVRDKMTEETMNTFSELLWKKDTYSHIELDDNYQLELYHKDGYPSVGSCSAAERALLALSFTLALQKVSGYDSMLFIDTPVGRVDSENRENFAKVLEKVSENKQIIMTFSTSEYSSEIENIFGPIASSKEKLITKNERETYLEDD